MSRARNVYVILFILLTVGAVTEPVSAQRYVTVEAKIIPPSPYQVYTSQTYSLTIGVQYDLPPEWYLWIESPPYATNGMSVSGSGITAFALMLTAPPTPGTYTLTLTLYGQTQGSRPSVMDMASVTYRVIQPIMTDWDVERVWLDPASPGEGDKVTFHATILLQSTNSKEVLTVAVACSLDKRLYYTGSLTFSPQPGKQDITIPNTWTAVKGAHVLTCIVDPNKAHNDPTPYPRYNFKDLKFTVETYYAIIQSITTTPPAEIDEGEEFSVVITVAYRFPGTATLKVNHRNNATLPPADDETVDGVKLTGSGTRDYTYHARAPFTNPPLGCEHTWILYGTGSVMFDKGSGWQKTDPGWTAYYNVTIRRPSYYALFDAITAQYMGSVNASGLVSINLQVRYLVPLQSGLRITVTRVLTNQSGSTWTTVIVSDESSLTQAESVERTATYKYDYYFPHSAITSDKMLFHASIDYKACGAWHHGDDGSASASIPYTPPPISIGDYFIAALRRIWEWSTGWLENLPKSPFS